MPPEIARLKPSLFCEALLVALDLEGGKDFQMGLSRVFFRAGKLAFLDDLLAGNAAQMDDIVKKVHRWLARKRWRQAIMAVVSIDICGKIIEDIREEARRREMERRMKDEAYQAELRRREELERQKAEEERKRKEEEARKKREEEERIRREKLERKRQKEEELKKLRQEAAEKLSLEAQLDAERQAAVELEASLRDDLKSLENELLNAKESGMAFEMKLLDEQASNLILRQKQELLNEEMDKLRKRISELEKELNDSNKKNELLLRLLDEERAARKSEVQIVRILFHTTLLTQCSSTKTLLL